MTAPTRESVDFPYHDFGPAEEAPRVALVAGLHGNETNGVFVLSRLADFLREVESGENRRYRLARRVVVIPAVNVLGVNTRTRAWPFDKQDINRLFPGASRGEPPERIAHAVLELTRRAYYRVDLHSSNTDFEELPQVRLYGVSTELRESAFLFGLPAIIERPMHRALTTTIGYAWGGLPGESFVIQAGYAGSLQLHHCTSVFQSLLRFLVAKEVLIGEPLSEDEDPHLFADNQTLPIIAERGGMFVSQLFVGRWVRAGEVVGHVYDAFHGRLVEEICAPTKGLLSGMRRQPLLYQGDLVARVQTLESLPRGVDTYAEGHGQ